MGYKEEFISAFSEHIHRDGAEALLAWMQTTDFFTGAREHTLSRRLRERPGHAQPQRL